MYTTTTANMEMHSNGDMHSKGDTHTHSLFTPIYCSVGRLLRNEVKRFSKTINYKGRLSFTNFTAANKFPNILTIHSLVFQGYM